MTIDEAIEMVKTAFDVYESEFDTGNDWSQEHKARDMAIKALEQESTAKNDLGVDWDELKRKIFMEVDGGPDDKWLSYVDVCDNISNSIDEFKAELPSVTPIRPKGRWIDHSDEGYVECPRCGSATNCDENINDLHFCFSCGAEMDGVEE